MNIILLGAPASGKGTQADMICSKYGVKHISTGNMIRDHVKNQTTFGKN
jgi:adenylate kinase